MAWYLLQKEDHRDITWRWGRGHFRCHYNIWACTWLGSGIPERRPERPGRSWIGSGLWFLFNGRRSRQVFNASSAHSQASLLCLLFCWKTRGPLCRPHKHLSCPLLCRLRPLSHRRRTQPLCSSRARWPHLSPRRPPPPPPLSPAVGPIATL